MAPARHPLTGVARGKRGVVKRKHLGISRGFAWAQVLANRGYRPLSHLSGLGPRRLPGIPTVAGYAPAWSAASAPRVRPAHLVSLRVITSSITSRSFWS